MAKRSKSVDKRITEQTRRRVRKHCDVVVCFDSEEMRDAFFGWVKDTGMSDFTSSAMMDMGRLRLDIECESPDKVFVGDMDVDDR
jgi:hypothetical protein